KKFYGNRFLQNIILKLILYIPIQSCDNINLLLISELKRRLKAQQKAQEKAEKDLLRKANEEAAGVKPKPKKADEEDISPNEYLKLRKQYVEQRKKEGVAVYPHKFHVSISLSNFLTKYESLQNQEVSPDEVTIAARVHAIRESSNKLRFYDVRGEGQKLQVMANLQFYESESSYLEDCDRVRRGDIIGVKGTPIRTKTGELSIRPVKILVLSPCLHMLPHLHYGLRTRGPLTDRGTSISSSTKKCTASSSFAPISSPTSRVLRRAGFPRGRDPHHEYDRRGPTAKPFITHHNA
ncbi:UNVERIFIED_CONTAM: hypothetical protein GTU68_058080, partial [Idotea baltica]|nr:hypothetical protein [Idotea baltica]